MFREALLSREGFLIDIPGDITRQGPDQLADYLRPKMESIAGGNLDTYLQS